MGMQQGEGGGGVPGWEMRDLLPGRANEGLGTDGEGEGDSL